ncbi:response regulator [Epibacterium sp. SM1979]|uniref:Response regulator n=1 Tax=Tritonibacter litoralis TaxID=2662264 RepID=A0A843YAD2_9RHOB|nr:response regulator [Tritonibacter litoralis]MQQ07951.1 response regulator [Tritonibacter litoralis]
MEDLELFAAAQRLPTARRPLLGLTVLVVEDSRFACEAMRLMCLRSGARIRRADCLKSARRHLQAYRPSAVIIDLGLPDGSGTELIAECANSNPRVGVVLGTSGDLGREQEAIDAGADGFLQKPISTLGEFQGAVLKYLPADWQQRRPAALSDEAIEPDMLAFQDDLAHAADILSEGEDAKNLDYVAQFVGGVARSIGDGPLADAAQGVVTARAAGQPLGAATAAMAGLVQDRLEKRVAI